MKDSIPCERECKNDAVHMIWMPIKGSDKLKFGNEYAAFLCEKCFKEVGCPNFSFIHARIAAVRMDPQDEHLFKYNEEEQ